MSGDPGATGSSAAAADPGATGSPAAGADPGATGSSAAGVDPAGGLRRAAVVAGRLTWRAAPLAVSVQVVCMLAVAAVPVAVAWLTKLVVDGLADGEPLSALTALAAALAGAGVAAAVFPHAGQYLRAEIDRRVALSAEDGLYRAVERFTGLARFDSPEFLDRLRMAMQAASTPGAAVAGGFGLLRGAVTAVGLVGSLAVISPVMTGVLVLTGIPMLLMELYLSRRRAAMMWLISPTERRRVFYQGLQENPQAVKEIRLFGTGGFLRGRMLTERRTADAAKRREDRRELAVQGGLALLGAVVAGAGLLWAVAAARRDALSIGDVSMFVAAVAGVQGALATLVQSAAQTHQHLTMFVHYVTVLRTGSDLPASPAPTPVPRLRRGIELRDVWFRYDDGHPWVLRGVNLFLPEGLAVALVGLNGAGKSTLIKLLCRFYDPTRGAILWDGVDLRDVDLAELRTRIGAVFQDYMTYDLSATENVALGDLSALDDPDRVRAAARRAGVHEVLDGLPRGYDTQLTRSFFGGSEEEEAQAGVRLSGGQWQRVALARAFLRDQRDLMILDEPSAGLDAEAEHEVHSRLREHRAGRTSLLISHRLGAIRDADRIVVLADGVVAEQGTHAELVAKPGTYARLFALQAAGYRDDAEVNGRNAKSSVDVSALARDCIDAS
ncbi:ABC transporter ATP-binding protein [Micromonospora cathayae]|uniref:ABC transporter ATP-binding protein n=1 Tax=Micromonospora cathayae TaxID=3028804 RepID=A0ABY7ZIY8_9ACTN|nr:ABC transporter ATP-binding protein [Micromonospora sp. HUAS 3]WDZ82860.1 ABC transporter ATP-binding protein [Micromonospora sp. HUAS 3]